MNAISMPPAPSAGTISVFESSMRELLSTLRRRINPAVTEDSVYRMVACHLGLTRRDDLIYVTDQCLVQAVDFVRRYTAMVDRETERGMPPRVDYGRRARELMRTWDRSDPAYADAPAPSVQALLAVLDSDGHDVADIRADLAEAFSKRPAEKPERAQVFPIARRIAPFLHVVMILSALLIGPITEDSALDVHPGLVAMQPARF